MQARLSNSRLARPALVVRGDGTDAARLMAEKWGRIKASRWAAGVRWPVPNGTAEPEAPTPEPTPQPKPVPDGPPPWWRTVSATPNACGTCRERITPGERFLYRHDDRATRCRTCGEDDWPDAKPSKALKRYAATRRREDLERMAA